MDWWQSPLIIFFIAALIAMTTAAPAQTLGQTQAPTTGSHLGKALPDHPTPLDEHLAMPGFPAGWVQTMAQKGPVEVFEYIPKHQTPQNWRDKITLEVHHGTFTLPIDAYQRRAMGLLRENCKGVFEGRLQTGVNNGFPAAYWTMGCKQDERGNFGETRYTKAIQGGQTLYLLSRAWRTPAYGDEGPPVSPGALEEAQAFLGSTVVCANSPQHPCPKDTPKP